MCNSMACSPSARARRAACAKEAMTWRMSCSLIARGAGSSGRCAMADGASGTHPPSAGAISEPPSQGARLDDLRPACDNWIASGIAETERRPAIRRCKPAWFSSL